MNSLLRIKPVCVKILTCQQYGGRFLMRDSLVNSSNNRGQHYRRISYEIGDIR